MPVSSALTAETAGTGSAQSDFMVKAIRGGSVRDLSLLMLLTFNGGVLLWLTYFVLVHAAPIVITNAATLVTLPPRFSAVRALDSYRPVPRISSASAPAS